MQDSTGLIYLRARYYDPKTARFVQVDNNYDGEKDHIGSQNKYVYTLGNPYKYVDRDGNRAFQSILPKRIPAVLIGVMGIVNGVKSIFDKAKDIVSNPPRGRSATNFPTNTYRSENRITPYKLPVAESSEAIKARQYKTSASFIASASCTKGEHKGFFAKAWDAIKEKSKQAVEWVVDNSELIGSIASIVGQLLLIISGLVAGAVAAPVLLTIIGVLASVAGLISILSGAISFVKGINLISEGVSNKDINMIASGVGTALLGVVGVCVGWKVLESGLNLVKSGLTTLGIWTNGESQGTGEGQGYNSFNEFKKDNPVKTPGNQQHHIVEQSQINKSGFTNQEIQNTNNIVEISKADHGKISGYYSSIQPFSDGMRVRDWLSGQSFGEQYQFGIDVLNDLEIPYTTYP